MQVIENGIIYNFKVFYVVCLRIAYFSSRNGRLPNLRMIGRVSRSRMCRAMSAKSEVPNAKSKAENGGDP